MADTVIYTNEAALAEAEVIRADLALSKIRLFDNSFVPDVNTTKAELVAAETTLVGYPAGGYAVAAYNAALFAPGGGAVIQSETEQVVYASGAAVSIGGYWVEDAAGDVREVFIYDPVRTLAAVGDGFPIIAQFGYGRNSV